MSTAVLVSLDFGQNQILNVLAQVLASDPGSPVEGQFWYNSTSQTLKVRRNGSTLAFGTLDQITAPAASVSLASQKIINLADPTGAQDAATKAYVDAFVNGLNWKDSVRAATTVAGTLATSFENGDTIDGVTLATGDRILIKNQAAPADNGIYIVAASGAPARATDADTGAEIRQAAMFVEEGTANADTAWILTTNAAITLGSTSLTFAQFGAGASYTADETTLHLTGTVFSLISPVAVANGGTGAVSAAAAKGNLLFMTRFAADVGDGSATSYNVDHNMATKDVVVQVYRISDGAQVFADVVTSTINRVVVSFAVAPTTNQYRVVVIG